MGTDNEQLADDRRSLFVRYSEEINKAYERAVRDALRRHKLLGNPVAVERDGKVVILQPDEIEIGSETDET
jgi:hypothetical protein